MAGISAVNLYQSSTTQVCDISSSMVEWKCGVFDFVYPQHENIRSNSYFLKWLVVICGSGTDSDIGRYMSCQTPTNGKAWSQGYYTAHTVRKRRNAQRVVWQTNSTTKQRPYCLHVYAAYLRKYYFSHWQSSKWVRHYLKPWACTRVALVVW